MRKLLNRILAIGEYHAVYLSGRVLGISSVIRYLRNPNPYVTIRLLRAFGAKVGKLTTIKRGLLLENVFEDESSAGDFSHLKIGENCYIGDGVFIDLSNEVVIEDNSVISGRVSLITHADCNRSKCLSQKYPRKCNPINIRNGSWIGFGATILDGVTIGINSVIAANGLVIENVKENCIYAGTPAKEVKGSYIS
jgi:acetyltransferase-like isoleucine patch superfamily enzyme